MHIHTSILLQLIPIQRNKTMHLYGNAGKSDTG